MDNIVSRDLFEILCFEKGKKYPPGGHTRQQGEKGRKEEEGREGREEREGRKGRGVGGCVFVCVLRRVSAKFVVAVVVVAAFVVIVVVVVSNRDGCFWGES